MKVVDIRKIYEKRETKQMHIKREYSVLMPLVQKDGELHVLFEVRAKELDTQPGEISFPGGKIEDGETPKYACIRETCEELGVKENQIEVVGELDYIGGPYNIRIFGYVGVIEGDDFSKFSTDEVDHCFLVPLRFFFDNKPSVYNSNIKIELESGFPYDLIPDGKNYKWRNGIYPVHFYRYKEYIIWGFTAKFITNFVDSINKSDINR